MGPIDLSRDQFNMLVEMCSKLFPEYEIVEYNEQFDDLTDGLIRFRIGNPYKSITFHWFEFCMTHLANELYNNIDYTDSSEFNINLYVDLMLDMVNFKINPIDFLYKEFLKTKTNNK